jgi:hypothetical protein
MQRTMKRSTKHRRNDSLILYFVLALIWILVFLLSVLLALAATGASLIANTLPVGLAIVLLLILACSVPINLALFGIVIDPILCTNRHQRITHGATLCGLVVFSWYIGSQSVRGIDSLNHPIAGIPFACASFVTFLCYLAAFSDFRTNRNS